MHFGRIKGAQKTRLVGANVVYFPQKLQRSAKDIVL